MNQTKRHFRLLTGLLLAVFAFGQAANRAAAANTFPMDGAGYEWNSVTWVDGPLLLSVPWKCEKCDKQHLMPMLWGRVDVDYINQRTGGRGSRRVTVWVNLREEDTRKLPDAIDVFLRRDGISIDAIDTVNKAKGLATLQRVYRHNPKHERRPKLPYDNKNGILYFRDERNEWVGNTLTITTCPCLCESCKYKGQPVQILAGTVKKIWSKVIDRNLPNNGLTGWTTIPIIVYSFAHANDAKTIPDPVEVRVAKDNYNCYRIDGKPKNEQLQLLRREWVKANRD